MANGGMLNVSSGQLPAGSVLQVVSVTKTDIYALNSTTFTDIPGVSATITPTSTSSKIWVSVTASVSINDNNERSYLRLMRGSDVINVGDAEGNRTRASFQGYGQTSNGSQKYAPESAGLTFLDSPASATSLTYTVQLRGSSGFVYINRNGNDGNLTIQARVPSTITLMEVAG